MSRTLQRWIAGVAIGFGLLLAVVGPLVVGRLGTAARDSLAVTGEALDAVAETVDVAASSIGTVRSSLDSVSAAAADLADTVDAGTEVLDEVAQLTATEIPESLEAFQDSLPALVSVGAAIDRTLRALSLFGVDYDPDRPFDEALAALGDSLEGVPERLRDQSSNLEAATEGIGGVVDNTTDIAASIASLDEDIRVTEELLGEYRVTTGRAARLVTDAESDVRIGVLAAQILLAVFGLVFAATQLPVLVPPTDDDTRRSSEAEDGPERVEPLELAEGEA